MREGEPWTGLRSAWNALEAPAPADDWREADERTRACVEWMRAAWSEVRPSRAASPPVRAWRGYRPWPAAAAAVLVGSLLSFAVERRGIAEAPTARSPRTAREEITVAAVAPDRLELISGPVRLVLLSPELKEEAR